METIRGRYPRLQGWQLVGVRSASQTTPGERVLADPHARPATQLERPPQHNAVGAVLVVIPQSHPRPGTAV